MVNSSTTIWKLWHVSKEFLMGICVPKKGWKNNHAYVFDGYNNDITIVITLPFKPHWLFNFKEKSSKCSPENQLPPITIPPPLRENYIFYTCTLIPTSSANTFCLCFPLCFTSCFAFHFLVTICLSSFLLTFSSFILPLFHIFPLDDRPLFPLPQRVLYFPMYTPLIEFSALFKERVTWIRMGKIAISKLYYFHFLGDLYSDFLFEISFTR